MRYSSYTYVYTCYETYTKEDAYMYLSCLQQRKWEEVSDGSEKKSATEERRSYVGSEKT